MNKVSKEENEKLTEEALMKRFADEHNKLCEKYGFRIQSFPKYLVNERGEWITKVQLSVEKIVKPTPKSQEKSPVIAKP